MENWVLFKTLKLKDIYVSNFGNVKSMTKSGIEKILSQYHRGGKRSQYLCFGYRDENNNKILINTHVAVALLFIGDKPDSNYQVDHIDNNPKNNHYQNLRWITAEENGKKGSSIINS